VPDFVRCCLNIAFSPPRSIDCSGTTPNSPTLQYQRDLFSAGLVENPHNLCDFTQRRKQYEEHVDKWSNVERAVKSVYELPREFFSAWHSTTVLGRNLIASRGLQGDTLAFARITPGMTRTPVVWWSTPPFPFNIVTFATHPPDNVLAVVEVKEQ